MTARYLLLLATVLTLLSGRPVAAEIDASNWRRMPGETAALAYENIEGAPYWAAGPTPRFDGASGLHLIVLAPNAEARIWLPPGTSLRLHQPVRPFGRKLPEVSFSNGSGLHLLARPHLGRNRRDLLFSPHDDGPQIARITAPDGRGDVVFAAFLVRREPDPALARDLLPLPFAGPTVEALAEGETDVRVYRSLAPGERFTRRLRGPQHIALKHRRRYLGEEGSSRQPYRLELRLGAEPPRERLAEAWRTRALFTPVPDGTRAVSEEETLHFEVPPGWHDLEVTASAPLYLRLLARSPDSYLFAGLNAPPALSSSDGDRDPLALERSAWLAQRGQGTASTALALAGHIESLADMAREPEALRRASRRLARAAGRFRTLLPVGEARFEQNFAWITGPHLESPEHRRATLRIDVSETEALAREVANTRFIAFPPDSMEGLVYRLPQRDHPSQLRLLVERWGLGGAREFHLRVDNGVVHRFRVHPEAELGPEAYRTGEALAGLVLLAERDAGPPRWPALTNRGPFTARRVPAPLSAPATILLPLPVEAREVRIWPADRAAEGQLRVALQLRRGEPFALSESAYLQAVGELGTEATRDLFLKRLHHVLACSEPCAPEATVERSARRDLISHWQGLLEFIRARATSAGEAIAASSLLAQPMRQSDAPALAALLDDVERLAAASAPLAALESLATTLPLAGRESWGRLQFRRVALLDELGEPYLAERLLRALQLTAVDPEVGQAAFDRLAVRYGAQNEAPQLIGVIASEYRLRPRPHLLVDLAHALGGEGMTDEALDLLLAAALKDTPTDSILALALERGWYQIFRSMLDNTSTLGDQRRALWRGRLAEARGQPAAARAAWRDAGADGARWLAMLEAGEALLTRLSDEDLDTRRAALREWAAWYDSQPGARAWRRADHLVRRHGGGLSLANPRRDAEIVTYRADAGRPLELEVVGPARLAFDVRLLAPGKDVPPETGSHNWLRLEIDGAEQLRPLDHGWPATPLASAQDGQTVGLRRRVSLSLGAGFHRVRVAAVSGAATIVPHVAMPRLPLTVLPAPTPQIMALVLAGAWRPAPEDRARPGACGDCILATGGVSSGGRLISTGWAEASAGRSISTPSPLVLEEILPPDASAEPVLAGLSRQVRACEDEGRLCAAAALGMAGLDAEDRTRPWARALRARLSRATTWTLMPSAERAAGLRTLAVEGYQPEAPRLRVRRALLPSRESETQILSAGQELSVAMYNPSYATFELTLATTALPSYGGEEIEVAYALDDRRERRLTLDPRGGTTRMQVTAPPGDHRLRFRIIRGAPNRFVTVTIHERHGKRRLPLVARAERWYQVARPGEPVVMPVAGPALLRVDELIAGRTRSRTIAVAEHAATVTLEARAGASESLYRVFRLAATNGQEQEPPPAPTEPAHKPRTEPGPQIAQATPPADAHFHDAMPLGGQEDGTTSLGAALVSRGDTLGEPAGGLGHDRYLEIRLTHRLHQPEKRRYLRAALLARTRSSGAPTLGLLGRLDWLPSETLTPGLKGLGLYLSAALFGQETEDEGLAGAASLRAGAIYRRQLTERSALRLRATTFARALSLEGERSLSGLIDRDVFTRYKADHRVGLEAELLLLHAPWLDTRLYGGIFGRSNEDGSLDNLGGRVGLRQLLGDSWIDFEYRQTRFLDDRDRVEPTTKRRLELAIGHELWRHNLDRLELGAEVRHEFDDDETSGFLSLTWHFGSGARLGGVGLGNGRGFRDFQDGEAPFKELRAARRPRHKRNWIEGVTAPRPEEVGDDR